MDTALLVIASVAAGGVVSAWLIRGSVAARLSMRGDAFPFVLAGGVFRGLPWLGWELRRRLVEVAPRCEVRMLEEEPAVGAIRLALAAARGGARIPSYVGST